MVVLIFPTMKTYTFYFLQSSPTKIMLITTPSKCEQCILGPIEYE